MSSPSDRDLYALLARDAVRGWRAFVEARTPVLLALIERAGLRDRDEALDIYTLVCERLSADRCAKLRRWDPAKGSLDAWLAIVVRRLFVDWVRSRAGRRRLFGVIEALSPLHQQVFQLYYWNDRTPSEIAEELATTLNRSVKLIEVLAMLDEIHNTMTERHYGELASMSTRSRPPISLDAELETGSIDVPDPAPSAEARMGVRDRDAALESALAALPIEDAAIVRLHYLQGLSLAEVRRSLHLAELTRTRLAGIMSRLKMRLEPV